MPVFRAFGAGGGLGCLGGGRGDAGAFARLFWAGAALGCLGALVEDAGAFAGLYWGSPAHGFGASFVSASLLGVAFEPSPTFGPTIKTAAAAATAITTRASTLRLLMWRRNLESM